jgi:hypothetical protein
MLQIEWRPLPKKTHGIQNVRQRADKYSNAFLFAVKALQAEELARLPKAPSFRQVVEQLTTDNSPEAAKARARVNELMSQYGQSAARQPEPSSRPDR